MGPDQARSVFAKINDLVQSRQKLPLWVFAGALFLFSVPFAATFFSTLLTSALIWVKGL